MRMVRTAELALVAAVGLFSACSGSTGPPTGTAAGPGASNSTSTSPAISPSSAASTGTTTATSGPRSSTPTVADLAVRFPKTQQGAEDFVRFLMASVSKAYATGDPSLIRPLVDVTTCPDCSRWVTATTEMGRKSQRYEGVFVDLRSIQALPLQGDAVGVITQVLVPAGKTVDSTGRTVRVRKASGPFRTDFFLQFRDHWVVVRGELVR
mgnify:CR=1 FL=1